MKKNYLTSNSHVHIIRETSSSFKRKIKMIFQVLTYSHKTEPEVVAKAWQVHDNRFVQRLSNSVLYLFPLILGYFCLTRRLVFYYEKIPSFRGMTKKEGNTLFFYLWQSSRRRQQTYGLRVCVCVCWCVCVGVRQASHSLASMEEMMSIAHKKIYKPAKLLLHSRSFGTSQKITSLPLKIGRFAGRVTMYRIALCIAPLFISRNAVEKNVLCNERWKLALGAAKDFLHLITNNKSSFERAYSSKIFPQETAMLHYFLQYELKYKFAYLKKNLHISFLSFYDFMATSLGFASCGPTSEMLWVLE